MSSILANIDTTINDCSTQIVVWKLWDQFIDDKLTTLDSYRHATGPYASKRAELRSIIERVRCIKLYDLVDVFNLSIDDIELLYHSDYVKEITSMNWFIWKDESPGYISGQATYEGAIKYLKTGETIIVESVEGDDSIEYILAGNIPCSGRNLKKQILCSQVLWSDLFISEFTKYYCNHWGLSV